MLFYTHKFMNIEICLNPTSEDINFLSTKINEATPNHSDAFPFAFFIRDDLGEIIAGCNGSVVFGSIYTDQLWVHPNHQRQGIGAKLMDTVHNFGKEHGCTMATIATMSFQGAKAFYEHIGYQIDFTQTGYVDNSLCYFLKRQL